MPHKQRILVLLIALAAVFVPLALIVSGVVHRTGMFMYPVDDAFIHMQVAKNLAQHGTWGINAGEFGSASSSILYTLILSLLFLVFGANVYIPLVVNSIAAVLLIIAVQRWLQRQQFPVRTQLLLLLLVIFFTPLPVLVLSGMEHVLQCLFSFLFLAGFSEWYQKKNNTSVPASILIYAVLTAMIRYEGLFMVGAACLLLLRRREWKNMFLLGIVAVLPLVLFAVYSVMKGSYPLPNSVLVKSDAAQSSLGGMAHALGNMLIEKLSFANAGITLLATQRLVLILPLLYLVFSRSLKQHPYGTFLLVLFLSALLHLALADTGKFYRYEAYLVCNATIITIAVLHRFARNGIGEWQGSRIVIFALCFLLLFPIVLRSSAAFSKAKQACINIYEQQYQMARFVQRYYDTSGIAANDIGAVSFYNHAQLLDVWGLANIEVARSRKGGYWNAAFIDSMAHRRHTVMAVVYDSWLGRTLPPQWKKAGTWTISNNVVCGDDTVSFYAIDPASADTLRAQLRSFEKDLPHTVAVKYD